MPISSLKSDNSLRAVIGVTSKRVQPNVDTRRPKDAQKNKAKKQERNRKKLQAKQIMLEMQTNADFHSC
jgi:hypothetical protein